MPFDGDVFTDAKHGALFVKPSYIIKEASRPASLKHINHNNLMRSEPFSRGAPKEVFFSTVTAVRASALLSTLTRNDWEIDSFINKNGGASDARFVWLCL